jgi:hypothetical protein
MPNFCPSGESATTRKCGVSLITVDSAKAGMRSATPVLPMTGSQRDVLDKLSRSQSASAREVQRSRALPLAPDGVAEHRDRGKVGFFARERDGAPGSPPCTVVGRAGSACRDRTPGRTCGRVSRAAAAGPRRR